MSIKETMSFICIWDHYSQLWLSKQLCVLFSGSWDYCANFEINLIFPEIAFIVVEGNLSTVVQSLGKNINPGFFFPWNTLIKSKATFQLCGVLYRFRKMLLRFPMEWYVNPPALPPATSAIHLRSCDFRKTFCSICF